MSLEDRDGNQVRGADGGQAEDQESDSVASKLSQELSNWRRKRTSARPHRVDHSSSGNSHSEPARTIKVRGHETLVIRKPKLVAKPPNNPEPGEG
jgi:hypothetical protein